MKPRRNLHLSDEQLQELKLAIVAKMHTAAEEIKHLSAPPTEPVFKYAGQEGLESEGPSHGDQALARRNFQAGNKMMEACTAAINRIDNGTYGICLEIHKKPGQKSTRCGEEISFERLKLVPVTLFCVDCSQARESGLVKKTG